MSINVDWQGDCQFKVTTSGGFTVEVDAENTQAPCPTELLLSALGSCSATDVALYFQDKGVNLESLNNQVTYTLTDSEPRLYESANLHFTVKGQGITASDVELAARNAITQYCHVCLMLQPAIRITHSVEVIDSDRETAA